MSDNAILKTIQDLKNSLEKKANERAREEGKLEAAFARLKELGCDSLAEAEEQLAALGQRIAVYDNKLEQGLKEFKEKYGEVMGL